MPSRANSAHCRAFESSYAYGAVAVEHAGADPVEVREVVERVEDRALVPARPRGRAHAVDDERVRSLGLGRVERVPLRVQPLVRDAAPLELGEQRLEPERVLVEDRDRPLHASRNDRPRRSCSRLGERASATRRAGRRCEPAPSSRRPRRRGRRRRRPAARCAPGAATSRIGRQLVPVLGDDRHVAELGQQRACELVDLGRRRAAACEHAEVDPQLTRPRARLSDYEVSTFSACNP